jgi:serine/threonine protein kinase
MTYELIAAGQRHKWKLIEKLGEGDAGEVYLVESILEGKQAILKRPRRNAYSTDILRQAAQIKTEGGLLKALGTLSLPGGATRLKIPALLDHSPLEDGSGERLFIVIERASGFDIKSLRQVTRFGLLDTLGLPAAGESRFFLQTLAHARNLPDALLIRVLCGVLDLLETVHSGEVWSERGKQSGILWNDVKAEHLYWDPAGARLTVIDWGNGQFIESDGVTGDRQHSRKDDAHQFIQEMGDFLAESNPELYERLEWPRDLPLAIAYTEGIPMLKERLVPLRDALEDELRRLRSTEASLCGTTRPEVVQIEELERVQQQMALLGDLPDFAAALNFLARLALQLATEGRLEEFQSVCQRAAGLSPAAALKWELLCQIAEIQTAENTGGARQSGEQITNALAAGVAGEWPAALWHLVEHIGDAPLPDWWDEVSRQARQVYLELEGDALTPYIEVSRTFYTLQSTVMQMADKSSRLIESGNGSVSELEAGQDLLATLNEEVIKKWRQLQPDPPNSGIDYRDINGLEAGIESILPGTREKLDRVLAQPKAQAEIVLSIWERKEFDLARRALRTLLIWDPDRRRLLRADRALGSATQWLAVVYQGAGKDEPFYDYITSVELEGRRLRNQVGPAVWLDGILDAFKRLRKGTKYADLLMEHPEILNEIPWLSEYRSREILSLPRSRSLTPERDRSMLAPARTISGMVEARLGAGEEVSLAEPLDTWTPEARGSSARVFSGQLRSRDGREAAYAIKVMRPDRAEYALPLFREEAQILALLRDIPGITPLIECGYLRVEEGQSFPAEDRRAGAHHLSGQAVRFGVEEVQNFLASMDHYLAHRWVPYLALEQRDQEHNLMAYCDAGRTHGWFLPLREGLILGIQICDILQSAHERNIIYRDHKILHYYWDPATHGVITIDWNIAKRLPQGLTDEERQFDLVQFGARALHHILTGRPATGSLPLGPNRPEDIEGSSMSYPVNWTYDDERLPNRVKEILEQVLNQGYTVSRELRQDLLQVLEQVPDALHVATDTGDLKQA